MLRLTLRTLLAYLDDTLGSAEAKDIGKKVAESEFAQETIERIKTVTRRRRLSAPPVEGDDHSLDPNTIAEYLDNVLPAPLKQKLWPHLGDERPASRGRSTHEIREDLLRSTAAAGRRSRSGIRPVE